MRDLAAIILILLCVGCLKAQDQAERTLDLAHFGMIKAPCVWYPQSVEFVNDEDLAIIAPVGYSCTKRPDAFDVQITIIDLKGKEEASQKFSAVYRVEQGPTGYLVVCMADHVQLLSPELAVALSIPAGSNSGCLIRPLLSPSHSEIAISDGNSYRLIRPPATDPIAEFAPSRGKEHASAVADDGFVICDQEGLQCNLSGPRVGSFRFATLGYGAGGHYLVGLVAQNELLAGAFDGKRLYAATLNGAEKDIADVSRLKPPFVGRSGAEISAAEPRRILYHVDGCLIGDFDDCYGVIFRRFAVFDSSTSKMLYEGHYGADAELKISPNGHVVIDHEGDKLRVVRIP